MLVPTRLQAVYWVLEKNVGITSMSWTIPAKSSNPQDTDRFQEAIEEAVRRKKLLFCTLRESEEGLIAQGFYPVGLEQVFRIGSATRTGNLVKSHSGDEKSVQFILPGLGGAFRPGGGDSFPEWEFCCNGPCRGACSPNSVLCRPR
jgi:hypothetical protein